MDKKLTAELNTFDEYMPFLPYLIDRHVAFFHTQNCTK